MSDFTDTTEGTASWNGMQGSTCLLMPRGSVGGTLCVTLAWPSSAVILCKFSAGFLALFNRVPRGSVLVLFLALSPIVVEAPVVLGSPCSICIPTLC